MAKEEVTLSKKFSKWRVFDKNGESIKTSEPMTPIKAVKYFKTIGVIGIN